ncbi:fibrillin-1-like [Plakobranchus ocellatus]|uniref:Fibrillin-1-like n=1 Tax=Plakobranchus ocellatus TaxID=259542 RepID=A0AAV4C7J5_9GAST|nr:fibrillin-1-like [Plakobranchus ocellatus]
MDRKKSNELVLKEANLERSLIKTIRQRQLQILGHICRRKGLEHLAVTGKIEGKRIRDIDECRGSQFYSCPENSTCVNTQGNYTCDCLLGYAKDSQNVVCIDIDECRGSQFYSCPENSMCVNTQGNYTCDCVLGYAKDSQNVVCIDVDECTDPASFSCPANSTCANHEGGYTCDCEAGYVKQNNLCVDLVLCEGQTCPAYSTCAVDGDGTSSCVCQNGYTLQNDTCEG